MKQDMIAILGLGSMENAVIARQIYDLGAYSETYPRDTTVEELHALSNVEGTILNDGESRAVDGNVMDVDPAICTCGYSIMTIDHLTAQYEMLTKLPKEDVLREYLFDVCKAQAD